jgi:hypothetical protein
MFKVGEIEIPYFIIYVWVVFISTNLIKLICLPF